MANNMRYTRRRSPPVLHLSPYLDESKTPVVNDCYMLEPRPFNARKRQHSEQRLRQSTRKASIGLLVSNYHLL